MRASRGLGLVRVVLYFWPAISCFAATMGMGLNLYGADYIDLFLIHDPYPGKTKRLETYKALLEARDEGKIRSIGVSN